MADKDIQTNEYLKPVYLAITCSLDEEEGIRKSDFDSNTIAARLNVETFKNCWLNLFCNSEDLEEKIELPKIDSEFNDDIYLVWSVSKKPDDHYGNVDFLRPILNRTYIGIVDKDFLKKELPKIEHDLNLQKYHFHLK